MSGPPMAQAIPNTINSASDVTLNNLKGGEFLSYSASTQKWYNVDGAPGKSPDLADVLNVDNSAGTHNLNMNSNDIINGGDLSFGTVSGTIGNFTNITATSTATVGTLNYTTLNPPIPVGEGLADTLAISNSAGSTAINMNSQNITNGGSISGNSIVAAGIGTNPPQGLITAARQVSAPLLEVLPAYAGIPVAAGLYFNASITTPTQLTGPSVTNPTICTNLDLRSGTNLFTSSPAEVYEWGGYWKAPQTIFPPPPYDDAARTTQIPPINQVHFEFKQENHPGWRFFAPMSDADCQIDPDDFMGLSDGDYIGGEQRGGWPDAFYVETAATLVTAHASQTVEFWFPTSLEGYGRIYFGLYYKLANAPAATAPTFVNQSFRLWMEHEGAPGVGTGDVRSRNCMMKWHLKDFFPTNGDTYYIYPVCRTDDRENTEGRILIKIGDGQPLDGCNPGDPPDFAARPPADGLAQNGQLMMRGYPEPAAWTDYVSTTPPSWQTPGAISKAPK